MKVFSKDEGYDRLEQDPDAPGGGGPSRVVCVAAAIEDDDEYDEDDNCGVSSHRVKIPRVSVPVGHWKDGLCGCCGYGCCHPHLCNALWCPTILTGQIMARLNLNWVGSPMTEKGDKGRAKSQWTFRIVFGIVMGYLWLSFLCWVTLSRLGGADVGGAAYQLVLNCWNVLNVAFFLYSLVLVVRVRNRVRSSYGIPPTCCRIGVVDDCCCGYWCRPCVVAQMARHTTDYATYPSNCCSFTGVPDHVPSIV